MDRRNGDNGRIGGWVKRTHRGNWDAGIREYGKKDSTRASREDGSMAEEREGSENGARKQRRPSNANGVAAPRENTYRHAQNFAFAICVGHCEIVGAIART